MISLNINDITLNKTKINIYISEIYISDNRSPQKTLLFPVFKLYDILLNTFRTKERKKVRVNNFME